MKKIYSVLAMALMLSLLPSCAHKKARPATEHAAAADAVDFPIIDAHIHTYFNGKVDSMSGVLRTKEGLLAEMKANGVVGAVAMDSQDRDGYVDMKANGIIHCAGIDPKRPYAAWLEQGLKSGKYSCVKIYLGYVLKYAYDPAYEKAYKIAEKYDVPVVFHTGDLYPPTGKLKYAHPMGIDDVATDHPKVTFVIAHAGNPWIETAAEIAYKNPNVYIEISAFLVGMLEDKPREQQDKYIGESVSWIFGFMEDPTKVIYGTDWPLVKMKPYIEAIKRAIPKEHWRAVFHDNAVRVYKLKPGGLQ